MSQRLKRVMLLLSLIMLACGAQVAPTTGEIPVSQESATELKQNFYQALTESSADYEAELRITNEQITSLVVLELANTGQLPLKNPQVWFEPGEIHMAGLSGSYEAATHIVAEVNVQNGLPVVEVTSAEMSVLSLPESTLQSITQTINEAIATATLHVQVTDITIEEGVMIIKGKQQQPSSEPASP